MTHDPLCPFAEWPEESCYQPDAGVNVCAVIAHVREDERTNEPPAWAYANGYAAALRDAVEAVKAHRVSGYFCSCGTEVNSQAGHHVAAIEALGGER